MRSATPSAACSSPAAVSSARPRQVSDARSSALACIAASAASTSTGGALGLSQKSGGTASRCGVGDSGTSRGACGASSAGEMVGELGGGDRGSRSASNGGSARGAGFAAFSAGARASGRRRLSAHSSTCAARSRSRTRAAWAARACGPRHAVRSIVGVVRVVSSLNFGSHWTRGGAMASRRGESAGLQRSVSNSRSRRNGIASASRIAPRCSLCGVPIVAGHVTYSCGVASGGMRKRPHALAKRSCGQPRPPIHARRAARASLSCTPSN